MNLTGTYYLTLGTSLWKNLSFLAKSKMAAVAAITANYKIGFDLKSVQTRDPFSIHMFSRIRNAMKLSFAFYNHFFIIHLFIEFTYVQTQNIIYEIILQYISRFLAI